MLIPDSHLLWLYKNFLTVGFAHVRFKAWVVSASGVKQKPPTRKHHGRRKNLQYCFPVLTSPAQTGGGCWIITLKRWLARGRHKSSYRLNYLQEIHQMFVRGSVRDKRKKRSTPHKKTPLYKLAETWKKPKPNQQNTHNM